MFHIDINEEKELRLQTTNSTNEHSERTQK